jgi:thiol-disulfide isomerase/thioredoxin
MKKKYVILLLSALLCGSLSSAQAAPKKKPAASRFVITGSIKGMKEGAQVRLVKCESYDDSHKPIASGVVKNHAFRIVGRVASPTLCQLQIDDKLLSEIKGGKYMQETGINMFVENVPMRVSALCYDSIPKSYEFSSTPLFREKYVTVTGGYAQKTFAEYRQYIYSAELEAWRNDWNDRKYRFFEGHKESELDTAVLARLTKATLEAQSKVDGANDRFVVAHPDYPISLLLIQRKLENHFTYSVAQFNSWLALLKNNRDTQRYTTFAAQVEAAKKFAKGTRYTDFATEARDSSAHRLSEFVNKEGYTLVDFWASWCGPCRASIPHVKELYKKYDRSKLAIVSVSCDTEKGKWIEAMDEERMPWQQLLLTRDAMKAVRSAYQLSGIPYLLLINRVGELVFATNSSDEMTSVLEKAIE